jgi:serine/threonine-protein kinase
MMAALAAIAAATLHLFDGTPWAKVLFYITLVASVSCMLWLWWVSTRGPVQGWQTTVARSTAFSAACASCIFFGVFSAAPAVMALAVVIFSQSNNLNLARGTYVAASLTIAIITLLDVSNIVSDPGIIRAEDLGSAQRIASQLLVELLLLAAYLLGRFTRKSSAEALAMTHQAMRELARREVIAMEAREGAQRAFNIGGSGRLSGTTFGSFRLAEIIGYGGMGEIYRAEHVTLATPAAVKIIHPHLCSDEKLLDRFLREAQLSASVESPYIVRVLDAGMVVQGPFIAMELLQGEDLATHFQVEGLLSLSELLALATQVGAGLDAAAGAKIVHRDIKPQNLFLVDTDAHPADSQVHKHGALHCKILDFGVARVMSGQAELTQGDTILGTPSYMSPEQATGKVTDHRTDLHALAAVLYRGCTGFLPFTGENSQAVLYAVVHSMPPDPSELAGLPESLDSFFAKAFAKNPDDRYQSGLELSNALGRACASFS